LLTVLNANGYVLIVDILNTGTQYWAQALATYKLHYSSWNWSTVTLH